MLTNISRGISPDPEDTGTIGDLRSPQRAIRRPEVSRSSEELLYIKVRGLIKAVKRGPLAPCDSFDLNGKGWRIALKIEDDGNQQLFGRFDNESDQMPTTIQATYLPTSLTDACANYNGPDGKYDGNDAIKPIVKALRPYIS